MAKFISQQCNIYLSNKKVLLGSGMDRFGMAQAFTDMGWYDIWRFDICPGDSCSYIQLKTP